MHAERICNNSVSKLKRALMRAINDIPSGRRHNSTVTQVSLHRGRTLSQGRSGIRNPMHHKIKCASSANTVKHNQLKKCARLAVASGTAACTGQSPGALAAAGGAAACRAKPPGAQVATNRSSRLARGGSRLKKAKAIATSVHEGDKSLKTFAKSCPRSAFALFKKRGYAPSWLTHRPSFMGGDWALGCTVCAAARHSKAHRTTVQAISMSNKRLGLCKQSISRFAKWSRFEVRNLVEMKHFANAIPMHECSDSHRLAVRGFQQCQMRSAIVASGTVTDIDTKLIKGKPPSVSTSVSDSVVNPALDPFRGRVPQPSDWLHAWAESSSLISNQGWCDSFHSIDEGWIFNRPLYFAVVTMCAGVAGITEGWFGSLSCFMDAVIYQRMQHDVCSQQLSVRGLCMFIVRGVLCAAGVLIMQLCRFDA
jgi:hypothetical protein